MAHKHTSKKKKTDDKTREFLTKCLACEYYTDGRCKKYNDLMDKLMEKKEAPWCSGEPIRDKEGELILIVI